MAERDSRYLALSLDAFRAIGGWAADCAERALAVYEMHAGPDALAAGSRARDSLRTARPGKLIRCTVRPKKEG